MLRFGEDPAVLAALLRIERKLDALLERAGIDLEADEYPEVRRLCVEGKKIEAIKLLREHTGMGLAEAKSVVDSM